MFQSLSSIYFNIWLLFVRSAQLNDEFMLNNTNRLASTQQVSRKDLKDVYTHTIHACYIYVHLVDFYGKR